MTDANFPSFADTMDSGHTEKGRAGILAAASERMQELYKAGIAGRSPEERYEALKKMELLRESLEKDGVIPKGTDMSAFGINQNQYNRTFTQACADYFLKLTQSMDIDPNKLKNPMALAEVSRDLDRMNRYFMGRGETAVSEDIMAQVNLNLKPEKDDTKIVPKSVSPV